MITIYYPPGFARTVPGFGDRYVVTVISHHITGGIHKVRVCKVTR